MCPGAPYLLFFTCLTLGNFTHEWGSALQLNGLNIAKMMIFNFIIILYLNIIQYLYKPIILFIVLYLNIICIYIIYYY
jgi:hypothetical protein